VQDRVPAPSELTRQLHLKRMPAVVVDRDPHDRTNDEITDWLRRCQVNPSYPACPESSVELRRTAARQ
jgi:hypothetical protein